MLDCDTRRRGNLSCNVAERGGTRKYQDALALMLGNSLTPKITFRMSNDARPLHPPPAPVVSLIRPGAMGRPPVHIAYTLLDQAHPTDIAASIFNDKVVRKPLHLRPTSPEPSSQDARKRRRHQRLRKQEHNRRKQKPKPLSAKEKRITGIYDIPKEERKHEIYVPLHKMWLGYMREVLGSKEGEMGYVTAQGMGTKLTSADYHGAEVTVVRSKCVGMVGLEGIVVRDTKFTFQIITKKNELKSTFTIFHNTQDLL